jgi:hypothetical protein
MSRVDGLATDFDIWPGGSGSPTLRISRITIGGTGDGGA